MQYALFSGLSPSLTQVPKKLRNAALRRMGQGGKTARDALLDWLQGWGEVGMQSYMDRHRLM